MSKVRTIYNQVGLFASSSPSSGYSMISNNGTLNNNPISDENYSLSFPIHRVISTSYQLSTQRTPISELGSEGLLSRPILNPTEVSLNINYYLMGLINEMRLGLLANIRSGDSRTGQMLYASSNVCPISGLISRDFDRSNDTLLNWPLRSRDSRNIYSIIKKDTLDSNDNSFSPLNKNNNFYTMGFGDCYLDSYSTFCQVGSIPQANLKFTCNNIEVYDGSTGNYIPSVISQNFTRNTGVSFYIPNDFEGTGIPTVILPQDIVLTINQTGSIINNLIHDFNDIKIQGYNITFQLQREPLYNLGYRYPMDRVINLPTIVNLSIDSIPGDNKISSLRNLLRQDDTYNISIKLSYQQNSRIFSGAAIQYDFIGANFDGIDDNLNISNLESNTYNFSVEMKPNDNIYGFFISGYLGIPSRTGYISYLSGQGGTGYILDSSGNKIRISTAEYVPLY